MFERILERVRRRAEARAARRRADIAERLARELPGGIVVEATDEGVRLSGPRLIRRSALDPALRRLLGRLR